MNDKIQLKRGTLENWLKADPVLMDGEMALVATNSATPNVYDQYKVGGGSKKFSELPYQGLPCLQGLGDSTTSPLSQKAITDWINKGYQFRGIATPSTNPGTPDGPVFYLASEAGTYSNFNGISVADGEAVILLWNDGAWTKKTTGFATQQQIVRLDEKIDAQKNEIDEAKEEALQAITNLADDEDLTSIDDGTGSNVLKFADRTYNANNFSGKGYKILRKNTVDVIDYENNNFIELKSVVSQAISYEETQLEGDIEYLVGSTNNGVFGYKDNKYYKKWTGTNIVNSDIYTEDGTLIDNNFFIVKLQYLYSSYAVKDNKLVKIFEPWLLDYNLNKKTITNCIFSSSRDCSNIFKDTNTVYIIRYDFDLNFNDISLKDGCVLYFDGGSISNGRITFTSNNIKIINPNFNNINFNSLINIGEYKEYTPVYKNYLDDDNVSNFASLTNIVFLRERKKGSNMGGGFFYPVRQNSKTGNLILDNYFSLAPINEGINFINVSQYGIIGDGVTDNSDLLNKLLNNYNWSWANATLYFPAGNYLFKRPINIDSFSGSIVGHHSTYKKSSSSASVGGNTVFIFNIENTSQDEIYCLNSTYSLHQIKDITFVSNSYNIEIDRNIIYNGNLETNRNNAIKETTTYNNINLYADRHFSSTVIDNCSFIGFSGTCIRGYYFVITNCEFNKCNICIKACTDTVINNIRAFNCKTIIDEVSALNQISNIRGDNIIGIAINNIYSGMNYISNVIIDWAFSPVFKYYIYSRHNSINLNTIKGRNIIDNKFVNKDWVLTYNNTTINDCYIILGNQDSNISGDINISSSHFYMQDSQSVTLDAITPIIGINKNIIFNNGIINISIDIDILDKLTNGDYKYFRYIIDVIEGSFNGYIKVNNILFKIINLQNNNYSKNTIVCLENNIFRTNGPTEQRPTPINAGFQYFDTTLKKPIWWTETGWVDTNGEIV